jgi:DNA-binding PadR family transcriptional regulator
VKMKKHYNLNKTKEQETLYKEYKKKVKELKKIEKEKKSVVQVFTKGLLPLYVLYILSLESTNGNDISRKIGERTKGRWIPSTGGIYPLLKKMEKSKIILGNWDNSNNKIQKIYTLTELGKKEFKDKKILLKQQIENSLEVFKIVYRDLYK